MLVLYFDEACIIIEQMSAPYGFPTPLKSCADRQWTFIRSPSGAIDTLLLP